MTKRVYAEIPKFKRVEATLREAVNGFRPALMEIDRALAGRRTAAEEALLKSVRHQTEQAQKQASQVLHRLYAEVEG